MMNAYSPSTKFHVQPSNSFKRFFNSVAAPSLRCYLLGLAVLLGQAEVGRAQSCAPVPAGLVGWWRAEGNAADFTGANAGILRNGVGFGVGEVSQAFDLNGVDQFVEIPNHASLNPSTNLTVEAWVYPRVPNDSVSAPILKKADGAAGYSLEMYPDNTVRFFVYITGTGWVASSPAYLPPNLWTHVAGVFDGNSLVLSTNGTARLAITAHGQIAAASASLEIGQDPSNAGRHFNGLVDEAAVYNTALSSSQVQAIYGAGNIGKCLPPAPPSLTSQPVSQTVAVGEPVALNVSAQGSAPLVYQWRFNGSTLAGATLSTLLLTDAQVAQSGDYTAFVTNSFGSVTSAVATLTVLATPPGVITVCDAFGLSSALAAGGTIKFGCDGVIVLNQPLSISQDTVLDANGHTVAISGNNALRPFYVNPGVHFTLLNLTIENGAALGTNATASVSSGQDAAGGALYNNAGIVAAVNCSFIANTVVGGNGTQGGNGGNALGGAVFNASGTLNFTNCTFQSNSVTGGLGAGLPTGQTNAVLSGKAEGGGIYNLAGTVVLSGCLLAGNHCGGSYLNMSSVFAYGYSTSAAGGGLSTSGGTTLVVGSEFSLNSAIGADNSGRASDHYFAGTGGGGAISQASGTLTLVGSTFSTNSARGGQVGYHFGIAGGANGGGILSAGTCSVSNCVFLGNNATGGTYGSLAGAARGGAFCNLGSAIFSGTICSGNSTLGGTSGSLLGPGTTVPGYGYGGAIFNSNALVMVTSTLSYNYSFGGAGGFELAGSGGAGTAGVGGAVYSVGSFYATNSTIAANQAAGGSGYVGGPLYYSTGGPGLGGGLFNDGGTAVLTYSTIAGNSTSGGFGLTYGASVCGGILVSNGSVTLYDSLVAQNPPGDFLVAAGSVIDGGHNLNSDNSINLTGPGSLNRVDPFLGPLANHGGLTPTMALLPGSPAIDAGDPAFCLSTDQRGVARPIGAACDIGAFEAPLGISGKILGYLPPGGVSVSDGSSVAGTDATGRYYFDAVLAGNHTITPSAPGVIFVPPSQMVSVGASVVGVNFQAYQMNRLTTLAATAGTLHFQIAGQAGKNQVLLYSTNLFNWVPILTNAPGGNGLTDFIVPDETSQRTRFFRTQAQ